MPPARSVSSDHSSSRAAAAPPLNLSFSPFEFRETVNYGSKRGSGMRELYAQLGRARREKVALDRALDSTDGADERRGVLMDKALRRLGGERLRDDPTRLSRRLSRKRSKKRKSARDWARRLSDLQQSVDRVGKRDEQGRTGKRAVDAANRRRRLAAKDARKDAAKKGGASATKRRPKPR